MYVKQISVFLENSTGTLAELTQLLGEKGIDLIALSIADTEHYGILRAIVSDTDKAVSELKNAGYTVKLTDVLAVSVPDKPGGLSVVLEALAEENIGVNYVYSFVRSSGSHALVIFRVTDLEAAERLFRAHNVTLLTQEQVCEL